MQKGVLFEWGAGDLTLTATDCSRIARATVPATAGMGSVGAEAAPGQRMVMPIEAVDELVRILNDVPDGAAVRLSPTEGDRHGLLVALGDVTLFSRPIEGEFPQIERIIPQAWRTRVTVETEAFRQAARTASLDGRLHPLLLDAAPMRLRLYARGQGDGGAETRVAAAVEGDAQRVVLSAELLLPILAAAASPRLELSWTEPLRPLLIREAGQKSDEAGDTPHTAPRAATWVVQPMDAPGVAAHVFA